MSVRDRPAAHGTREVTEGPLPAREVREVDGRGTGQTQSGGGRVTLESS